MDVAVPLVDTLAAPLALAPSLLNTTALVALKEEINPETCELLGPFALVVQAIMGVVVVGSLLLKRAHEKPRRRWKVWLGDVGKQIVGQAFVHSSNVAISDLIARHKLDNPCSLYALNIFIDTTLGVLIVYSFLRISTHILKQYSPAYKTGYYGNPFQFTFWARQAAVYVGCLTAMKIVVLLLFWAFPTLFVFANWCLSWLESDEAQVIAVMLIFPIIMNLFQFLITDSILRSKELPLATGGGGGEGHEGNGEDEERGFLEDHDGDRDEEEEDAKHLAARGILHAAGACDSGYDTVTTLTSSMGKTSPPLGLQTDGLGRNQRGSFVGGNSTSPHQQFGSGLERRLSPSIAYPPSMTSSAKRIVVPVRIETNSQGVSPIARSGTPASYLIPPTTTAVGMEKPKEEEEDDWGDNFSISSEEGEVGGNAKTEKEGQNQNQDQELGRGSLERAINDLLANDQGEEGGHTKVWNEKLGSPGGMRGLDRIRTTTIDPLAVGEEDEEAAEGWGL
ncbi:BQ5605_C004g03085 [Microbotryum silenes-dioicae]|uniref:BQ5605_C004g03085 protein n=1 Tax=Microbotryum silenes-dioicae TaxID=796604 RepID=A0A2X0PBZ5_9BASI|nr:BQ5605_C004g03085 [Microbotryum silenes-dioicae]